MTTDKQKEYIASLKLRAIVQIFLKVFICCFTLVALYLAPRANQALLSKLCHQVSSLNETWDKLWESLPKAKPIWVALCHEINVSLLAQACQRTWETATLRMPWREVFCIGGNRGKESSGACLVECYPREARAVGMGKQSEVSLDVTAGLGDVMTDSGLLPNPASAAADTEALARPLLSAGD